MSYVAIIPARGGSKGIPGKNLRALAGKPLIQHSIDQALAASRVSAVYVTTDDAAIAEVSRQCGATVLVRPAELATDAATSESALLHAIDQIATRTRRQPDAIVFLQCTSPLRAEGDIDRAIEYYEQQAADSLLSVVESHRFIWRERDGDLSALNYDFRSRPRRQDLLPDLTENGSMYIFNTSRFLETKNRLFGKIVGYRMAPETLHEIDEEQDLVVIEALLQYWRGKG